MITVTIIKDAMQKFSMADMRELADKSGVPFRTLYKIKRGDTKDPRGSTLDRLAAVLLRRSY